MLLPYGAVNPPLTQGVNVSIGARAVIIGIRGRVIGPG